MVTTKDRLDLLGIMITSFLTAIGGEIMVFILNYFNIQSEINLPILFTVSIILRLIAYKKSGIFLNYLELKYNI